MSYFSCSVIHPMVANYCNVPSGPTIFAFNLFTFTFDECLLERIINNIEIPNVVCDITNIKKFHLISGRCH